ncbi:hypothetical protein MED121_16734 [Marinomonas sp. MED121]|uniref:hypothetical protein n=1 Tax=Marinomonas sp. MED121 TaxID=314277 RepID=UPI0000691093|nr:hypothetical protein [Marinomonas sp. MED121]EAQ67592.1 hypothetical protein MED121_16734 [Marinomonas sp. MED121]
MYHRITPTESVLLNEANQIEADFSSFNEDNWQAITPTNLSPEQVRQKLADGEVVALADTPNLPLFCFNKGETVVNPLALSYANQDLIRRLNARFDAKGSGASFNAQSNGNLHPPAPMEEKAPEPVVKDPKPEASKPKVPASFGQPPAPIILEVVYDDQEKTPVGDVPYKIEFDDPDKKVLQGSLNPMGWACVEDCPNANAYISFGEPVDNQAVLDKLYTELEKALDNTIQKVADYSLEKLKDIEISAITEASNQQLKDYLAELSGTLENMDMLSFYQNSLDKVKAATSDMSQLIDEYLLQDESDLDEATLSPIQYALCEAVTRGDIDALESALAGWQPRADIKLKAESKAMEKQILIINDQQSRNILATSCQRFVKAMTPEKLIDLAVYLSIKTTEDASLNSVSNLIGILTGKVSLAITRQVLLSATTDTKTDLYKDIAQTLTSLVKPLKTLRPFDAQYSHKKVIEIPLAKADIQPSDWAKKTENDKIKTVTDKPDDSILDDEMDKKWLTVPKGQLTFDVEGNDTDESYNFSRIVHLPVRGKASTSEVVASASGITIGRGLDVGSRSAKEVQGYFDKVAEHCRPVAPELITFLKDSVGMKGAHNKSGEGLKGEAKTAHIKKAQENDKALIKYVKDFKESIKDKSKITLTRKQQYYLFLAIYDYYEGEAKRLSTKPDVCRDYLNDKKIDWDALPKKVKDVLVDLTYRGDYTGTKDKRGNTRKVIVPAVYKDQKDDLKGVDSQLYKVLKNESLWKTTFGVDGNRFTTRRDYL